MNVVAGGRRTWREVAGGESEQQLLSSAEWGKAPPCRFSAEPVGSGSLAGRTLEQAANGMWCYGLPCRLQAAPARSAMRSEAAVAQAIGYHRLGHGPFGQCHRPGVLPLPVCFLCLSSFGGGGARRKYAEDATMTKTQPFKEKSGFDSLPYPSDPTSLTAVVDPTSFQS
jgi:hypothetical protein